MALAGEALHTALDPLALAGGAKAEGRHAVGHLDPLVGLRILGVGTDGGGLAHGQMLQRGERVTLLLSWANLSFPSKSKIFTLFLLAPAFDDHTGQVKNDHQKSKHRDMSQVLLQLGGEQEILGKQEHHGQNSESERVIFILSFPV